ncbi:MAG: type I-U CRISPR-associated protein Csb2 [Pyrinomonadaceae bacterium]
MIAIKMRFLVGRFHATPWGHHVNEGAVEYPPSLWRLLRSLVATYHRTASENFDEASLERILNSLSSAPEFKLPNASVAHTRHYDQANGGVKFFDAFVSIKPDDEIIWLWRDENLEESDRINLIKLLRNLGTFGRSESWCEAELVNAESEVFETNSVPVSENSSFAGKETIRLLLPNEKDGNLLKTLRIETSQMRGKDKQLEPNGSRWVTYQRASNLLTPRRISPKRKPKIKQITVARFALSANVLPLVTGSLPFAELVRKALIRNRYDNGFSEVICGKLMDGTPLENHQHAHYIATDEDNDGRIDHLTIFAPRGFNEDDVSALNRISSVNWRESRTGIRLVLTGLGNISDFARDDNPVALFDKKTKFRSVTPFSLPNFPNRGGGKPARPKDTPEGQLRRELRKRGLPEPIAITPTKGFFPRLAPIKNIADANPRFRWLEFTYRRFNGTSGNGLAGFEIEFATEDLDKIETPLTLGFGCHFGLGLFLPVTQ